MIKTAPVVSSLWLAAAVAVLPVSAQKAAPTAPQPAPAAKTADAAPNRAQAYYHYALAHMYEDDAMEAGRPDLVTRAIDEFKYALDADPGSAQLNNGLADLYFRAGRTKEAEATARLTLKSAPDDLEAHKLLGRVYLRQLSEGQGTGSPNPVDEATAEYEKIIVLEPKNVEDRILLGQLYNMRHEAQKAEEQFNAARTLEPASEEVVLNMARLYAEDGNLARAAKVIEDVPVANRSPKMEFALGAAYDQLKQYKNAIAAYQRANDMEPGDARTIASLAQSLMNDDQLDEALKQYRVLADNDPEDGMNLVHIGEILRRQSHFEEALQVLRKAEDKVPAAHPLEYKLQVGYHEGLLLDALDRLEDATQVYVRMVDLTAHANGAYTPDEKSNRAIFLERLGAILSQRGKVEQAIATYQKLLELGGEQANIGYRGLIDAYTDARDFDHAVEIAHKAVDANPKDAEMKGILAEELINQGKTDDGIALARKRAQEAKDDRAAWTNLGHLYVRLRRWKEAEEAYAKAEPLSTKKEDRLYLLYLRGELAERQKRYEQAEQLFNQALELDPNNAITLNYLGYMLADKGSRLTEAVRLLRKAVDQDPTNGAIRDSLGWAYFKIGQYELAETNLLHAVERDAADPTVHDHLGDLYEKTGRIRLAAEQWKIALAGFAHSAPADVEPGDQNKVQRKLDAARAKLAKQDNALGNTKPE